MTDQYEKDKMLIPEENLVEVRYDEFESKPLATVKKIYDTLNIPGFEPVHHNLLQQLQKEKQYLKFRYEYDEKTFEKINSKWHKHIYRWNKKALPVAINEYT